MLVLSRQAGEEIVIGDPSNPITIKVFGIVGSRVKIGIDAPRRVEVRRAVQLDVQPGTSNRNRKES